MCFAKTRTCFDLEVFEFQASELAGMYWSIRRPSVGLEDKIIHAPCGVIFPGKRGKLNHVSKISH